MENRYMVTASPHIVDRSSTRGLMGNVIIALLPCVIASVWIFGLRALLVVGVTTAACVGFEYVYCLLMKKPKFAWLGDYALPISLILGMASAIPITAWLG